jgi:transposase
MTMLADRVDAVIGVDTHTDTHTAAICDARGGVLATLTVATTAAGYTALLDALLAHAPGPRLAWAIEGTGSYGAGLTELLLASDAEVIEVRAARRRRGQGKNDTIDAIAIARAALAQTELEHARPRTGTVREALRLLATSRAADVATRTSLINRLKAHALTGPAWVRDRLRDLPTNAQIATAARLRGPAYADEATRAAVQVLRSTAAQIVALTAAIAAAEARLDELTATHAAALRAEYGIGPVSAAQILISWSHPGRIHSEAAFAALAGASPLEASSGRTTRHRLNRTGDRQLNAALHRIVLTRRAHDHPETRDYITRRTGEGKTLREIQRCLKRYLARHLYRILETLPALP